MPTERYLPCKEIAAALSKHYGLGISPDYVRAVRRETERRGERLFVAGMARPGDVMTWLSSNPGFRVRPRNNAGCAVV